MTGKNRGINGKQLNGSSIDMKRHVKMYKAGKKWLAAGLSTAVLGLTVIGGQQEVNASTNLSNVEQGTSEATSSVNSSALNASSAVVLNTSSSSSNVDNSAHEDQGATVSQSIQTESSASSVGSAVSKTAQDSSTGTIQATSNSNNVQVTNLSNPSSDEITVAQSAASERYQQTGQPQQINAVAATTPVAETTGTVTVNYVNKDTGELITFNQSQSSLTADAGTVVNGSYIAKTTISAASVTKMKVNTKYAQASIAGYKFVGNDTTDFTFVPIGETKTIIAYYEQLAPLIVQYVNEDDESDIIYQNIYDVSKPGMRASGLSSYDVSYNIPELWGYTYDSSKTDQSTLKGTFKSIDDTDGQALIVKVFYKKTTSDINKGALYLTGVINQPVSDSNSNGSGDNNPSVSFNGTSLPSTAIKISNSTSTTPAQYQNYTLVEATGFSASAETYLGSSASYIPNQPVKVVFGDDSTGKVLLTKSLGDFDPANGVIPSGNYDTSVVNDEQQSSLESQGYRLLGVYGMTSGTYDEMHRVVYYMYTPKLDYGEVTVTRTINFTSSDSSAVLPNPEVQEVTYKTVKNEVTGEIVYTPQEAFYEYIVPNVENYTASQSKVDQEALAPSTTAPTNQTVTINYTPALVHGEVTVDRTISYEKINGSKLQADTVQQVTYKFETNKVSGETVYTPQGFYPAIVSPSFSGYQTTQTTINQDLLKPTTETPKSTKMVVSYTPNKQRATVEIVDQNGKKLDTINVEGVSDGAVDHSTVATAIQGVINQGYNLTSDGTVGATYDHDDDADQTFKVVMTQLGENKVPYTTIPTDPEGNPIPGTTGESHVGKPGDPVETTDVPGYTPTTDIPDVPTDGGDVNVIYTPNKQRATVEIVDQNGKKLDTINVEGVSDGMVDHSTIATAIQGVINQGYNLTSDGTVGATYDHDDDADQTFKVVMTQLGENKVPYTTIPTDPEGNPIPGTTGESHVGKPGDPVETTDVPGYTPTTDIPDVPTDGGDVNVVYTPNKQRATVEIVDQNGNTLKTVSLTGVSDANVDHSTVATAIQGIINQGYNLTSDGTIGATYDHDDDADQIFKVVMTQLGDNKVPYTTIPTDPEGNPIPGTTGESHVGKPGDPVETTDVPGYTPTTDVPDVPTDGGDVNVIYTPNKQRATVEIVDQNGKKLDTINVEGVSDGAVDHSTIATAIQGVINQGYNLTSDGTVGATYDHDDDADQTFKVVMTQLGENKVPYTTIPTDPEGNPIPGTTGESHVGEPGDPVETTDVPGYTPTTDIPDVPTDGGDVNVVYTPNKQRATVEIVDQNGNTLKTVILTGVSDANVDHSTIATAIQGVINQGYNLTSDGTVGATYDHDDDADQTFKVVMTQLGENKVPYTTIPTDPEGNPIPGTTGESHVGKPGDPVETTAVPGYTPTTDIPDVPTDGGDVNVVYTPNKQRATVEIVDQNGKKLDTINVEGVSDGAVDHSTIATAIQGVINQGYNLTSDGTVGATYDHDDDTDQIFKVVMTKIAAPDDTDNNGNPVPPTNNGGDVDNGGNTNNGNDNGNGNVDVPTNNGSETPAQPNTNGSETPSTTTTNTGNGTTGTPKATETTYVNDSGNTNTGDTTQKANANRLPQTDNSNESLLAEIGVAMMGLISVFGLGRKKKHEDD